MRQALLAMIAVLGMSAACGGDDGGDDSPGNPDAPPGTPDGPPVQLSCATYCATIGTNCTGENAQYGTPAACMATCDTWMVGTSDDMMGNTLGCRTYHAGAAAGSPTVHCRHAGPGGDGFCGQNCEGFCTLVLGVCTGGNEVYADNAECMTACARFDPDPPYSAEVQGGDSFACRLYHATVASTLPDDHCSHTAEVSLPCQ